MEKQKCGLCDEYDEFMRKLKEHLAQSRKDFLVANAMTWLALILFGMVEPEPLVLPVVAVMFVFGSAYLIWSFPFYLRRNIIGRTAYWFIDEIGLAHHHLREPRRVQGVFTHDLNQPVPLPMLVIPINGWFRTPRAHGLTGNWKVVGGAKNRILVADSLNRTLGHYPSTVIRIIRQHKDFDELAPGAALEMGAEWAKARVARDQLGRGIAGVIHYLRESKNATRSKVGQHARELLEEALNATAGNDWEKWMEHAPAELEKLKQRLVKPSQPEPATTTT